MARFRLILVISWICAGCAATFPRPSLEPDQSARPLRLLETEPGQVRMLGRSLVAAPPFVTGDSGEADCQRFSTSGAEDRRLDAGDVVADWEAGLREVDGPYGWLLQPVAGAVDVALGATAHAAGLRADEDSLVVCTERPTPDWAARLEHPALWPVVRDPPTGRDRGSGPFRWSDDGTALLRVARDGKRPARVDRIEIVRDRAQDAVSLFGEGQLDLAIVYGRAAGEIRAPRDGTVRMERLPGWDKIYALWLGSEGRWVNDPAFRRWVAAVIDRESMVRYLFGTQGQTAQGLTDAGRPRATPAAGRPFSRTSSPRLTLAFDRRDRHAESIAARIKAVLEREGVKLLLEPRDSMGRGAQSEDEPAVMLMAHHPPVGDPVLGLLDTLWPLRVVAREEIRRLLRATRISDPGRRGERAGEVESRLIDDARLVPLVRLQAWLARREGLSGVGAGRYGVLRLDRAEWVR
jgi:MarR-like DNA-binding transcriptional regulator SgrR of sgrS sRNA